MEEQKLDALLYPTMKRKPARIGEPQGGSNCQLSASTGFPAISMPAGFTGDGLPVGNNLWAVHGYIPVDGEVLMAEFDSYDQAASTLEQLSPRSLRRDEL